jgi:hypothetical protein
VEFDTRGTQESAVPFDLIILSIGHTLSHTHTFQFSSAHRKRSKVWTNDCLRYGIATLCSTNRISFTAVQLDTAMGPNSPPCSSLLAINLTKVPVFQQLSQTHFRALVPPAAVPLMVAEKNLVRTCCISNDARDHVVGSECS